MAIPPNPWDSGSALWRDWNFSSADGRGTEHLLWCDREFKDSRNTASWDGPNQTFGPLALFPTGTGTYREGSLRPSLAAKIMTEFTEPFDSDNARRHAQHGTGLTTGDEISALIALLLDVRIRNGGPVRIFPPGGDAAGFPWYGHHAPPVLVESPVHARIFPPKGDGEIDLGDCDPMLSSFGELSPVAATVLVKAARHYSEGLWLGEADPEQAWLQFVTALEVVAVHHQTETIEPVDVFRAAYPGAAKKIVAVGGEDLLESVAKDFKRLLSAGRRVQTFMETFYPDPPERRPVDTAARVDWDLELLDHVKKVYGLRSSLLHSGTPFPAPLLVGIGSDFDDDGCVPERPDGIWSDGNSEWDAADLPMHIHVFAHAVRGALLNWWKSEAQ
ncbi:hypothetical protein [Streptomyces sp. SS52]|uniref:hypothetical protein n=1 Tax=Streptomyces sp. SS52 TaxID=2563602 RepID=UPI00109E4CB0|nr:hypothetical protein [Streptomyces sp. SS52]QCB23072.1 hypothetical protein E5N77_15570 [Streptomyces sp. SS52]